MAPDSACCDTLPLQGGYDDARHALMGLLQVVGLSREDAVTYTPHSFRHWLPTIARQLEAHRWIPPQL